MSTTTEETQTDSQQQSQMESQGTTTQETQEKSSGQEQRQETKKSDAPDKKKEYLAEGRRKESERIAKELGLDPKSFDLNEVKAAIAAKRSSDEASKSAEEKLASAREEAETNRVQAEAMRGVLEIEAKAKVEAQPEALQKLVTATAGDDPLKQMEFMASESFKAVADQISGGKASRAQGVLNSGSAAGAISGGEKELADAEAKMKDPSASFSDRQKAASKVKRLRGWK